VIGRCAATSAAIAALVLPGCGGGSGAAEKPSAPGAPLTRTQYVAKANALCHSAGTRAPAFPGKQSEGGYETKASLVIPYLQRVLAINVDTVAHMRSLRPPTGQAHAHRLLIAAQQRRIDDLSGALSAARRGDGTNFTAAFQKDLRKDEPAYRRAAAALGLTSCIRGR
jgi:hypothetical protein